MGLNVFNLIKQNISPAFLGVDIGTASIKVVEVDKSDKTPRLLNYAILENEGSLLRSNAAFQTTNLKLFDKEIIEFLKTITKKSKFSTNQVVASIPVFSSFVTILRLPQMSDEETKKALMFEAKQYVPLPLEEVAFDWQKLGVYEDEKGLKFEAILLISVPRDLIKKYQYILKSADLNLIALEIEPFGLVRSVILGDLTPTILVDIGNYATSISLVSDAQLKFATNIDFGGMSLTYAISKSLNINPLRAEEIKRERGILETGVDYELTQTMLPIIDIIIGEIQRTKLNYENNINKPFNAERIILCGGGANLIGIENYFSKKLGIPVLLASPLNYFSYPIQIEPLLKELNTRLSVSLGLGMRQIILK